MKIPTASSVVVAAAAIVAMVVKLTLAIPGSSPSVPAAGGPGDVGCFWGTRKTSAGAND
jgi:hypothetical protein